MSHLNAIACHFELTKLPRSTISTVVTVNEHIQYPFLSSTFTYEYLRAALLPRSCPNA